MEHPGHPGLPMEPSTTRSDAETASMKAQLQVLRAELSASEDQQVQKWHWNGTIKIKHCLDDQLELYYTYVW